MDVLPAVLALVFGALLAVAGVVPWAAVQYRRRGSLGLGQAVLAFAVLVYALALVTYTLLPLPDESAVARLCADPSGPQLRPFAFVGDIAREGGIVGPRSLLANPAATQVVFNVVLFVPLGMIVRQVFLRGRFVAGLLVGTVSGFAVSLLIECTQLTGDWFLYPCAYRLFDVDDLFANTLGALVGTLLAPVLVVLTRRRSVVDADRARPVTALRRFFGMLSDLLAIVLTNVALITVISLGAALLGRGLRSEPVLVAYGVSPFVAPLVQLVLVLVTGRTLGEAVVRLRPSPRPVPRQRIVRWALGSGGWAVLSATGLPFATLLAGALAVAAVVGVWATRDRRGFANAVARTGVVDERAAALPDPTGVGRGPGAGDDPRLQAGASS